MNQPTLQQGFTALQSGQAQTALDIARLHGKDPNGRYLEGLALRALGQAQNAFDVFEALNRAQPQIPDFANLMALCQTDLGEIEKAIAGFEAVLDRHPSFLHAAFNLGRTMANAGRMDDAITSYQRALDINPDHLPSRRNLAWCLEQRHRMEEAEKEADTVLATAPRDPLALSVKAAALIKRNAFEDAASLIGETLPANTPAVNASLALGKRAEALEKSGRFEAAFTAWTDANQRLKQQVAPEFDAVRTGFALPMIEQLIQWPLGELAPDEAQAPVFLVGFPRSGTTLMESVLAAHPDIETSDEQPLSTPLIEAAGTHPQAWQAFLESLPERREALQSAYWAGWSGGQPESGKVFIDKLPLNLPFAGLLSAVFPNARFILALRDPRDCVLSAFKQRFGMNAAMYRMLTLDEAATYYAAAMTAGSRGLDALPESRVIKVRYEDCVDDLEHQARRLIGFLGLQWAEEIRSYRDMARAREISTPSAPQVVQPIYKSSTGRWRDYAKALALVRPTLDHWAELWGYPKE